MVNKLDFVLFKVSIKDVNMVTEVLQLHGFTVVPWFWYKMDQNMVGTFKPVPAVEHLVYGYNVKRRETLFAGAEKNPERRHNMIMGNVLRSRLKNEKGEEYNIAQSPVYLWYNLLHDLGGGVDVIIDVCAGTGSASVAALELGYNVISVEKNETQFEGLTRRMDQLHKDLHDEERLVEGWKEILKKQRDLEGSGGNSYQMFKIDRDIRDEQKEVAEQEKAKKRLAKELAKAAVCSVCDKTVQPGGEEKCLDCGGFLHAECSIDSGRLDDMGSLCKGNKCQQMVDVGGK
jgi:hypothetical protein